MRITDLLAEQSIILQTNFKDKISAIDFLVELQQKAGHLSDKDQYKQDILKREESGSTAIGEGIAIPHAKSTGVKNAGLVAVTIPNGVDFQSLDGAPTNLIFMIAAPEKGENLHLEVLSRLSTFLMDDAFRQRLMDAKTPKAFRDIITEKESAELSNEASLQASTSTSARVLAVTACPTGIAHTFMAAEALEKSAKKLGYSIKVETNGSSGAKNVLTAEDIQAADGIIIAADKNVEMSRFNGKPVLRTKVADGIHKPDELIETIIQKKASIYYHHSQDSIEQNTEQESIGRQIYKHLMNGVSYMLPFVIGGGILIALAFLLDDYSLNPAGFGSNTPIAAWFKSIGDIAFQFMLPILSAYIATSIADRPGLLAGFIGGYIASLGSTFADPSGMETVSAGFLGALASGFLAGYLILGLKTLCAYLPEALEGIKPVLIYPVVGLILIGIVMCTINPFMASINTVFTNGLNSMGGTSKILLGFLLGGMMAADMGGPINKAAYVFGTASLASGGFDIMAAVMAGGMVPPLITALSTTFFKNKFTAEERKSGFINYIMGLCFITESAIPFAAADPLRVLPACIAGSATAGGISMLMNCTLRAPHGGIFVLPVIGNPFGYILALLAGSVVGSILLGILKKPITIGE